MTKADEFQSRRRADYASMGEYFDLVLAVDPQAKISSPKSLSEFHPVITFSDGSTYPVDLNG